jgi:DNA-binding GntR family transcriptional regulator
MLILLDRSSPRCDDPSDLAKRLSASRHSVVKALRELEEHGYIRQREKRVGYQIVWSKMRGRKDEPVN